MRQQQKCRKHVSRHIVIVRECVRDYSQLLNFAVSFPPSITAPESFMATVGEESVYTFTVSSSSDDISVIILHEGEETLPSGVQLNNPDGGSYNITWTPADNTSVLNLTIVAMDPNADNISSFFNPVVQLCACVNGGNCTTEGLLANDLSFVVLKCKCPGGMYYVPYIKIMHTGTHLARYLL